MTKQAAKFRSRRLLGVMLFLAAASTACSEEEAITVALDFRQTDRGWVGDFADYPVGEDEFYQLVTDYRALPEPLSGSGNGLFISGVNRSDDLWMYYKGQIAGLSPPTRAIGFSFGVEFATSVPNGCIGVGGATGEGVTVKAGASEVEPTRMDEGGFWLTNVNKGLQTNGGEDALAIGDVANSIPCGEPPQWELKQLASDSEEIEVTADGSGAVWLFVGTDSGFESITSVYYAWVRATFQPL